jgi:alpha-galactosidase
MMMDALTGAVCDPPEIWQMVDELLVAQERWLPQYAQAIEAAKKRLESGNLIPTREGYKGAARLHTKTVGEMEADREASTKLAAEADKAKERPAAD